MGPQDREKQWREWQRLIDGENVYRGNLTEAILNGEIDYEELAENPPEGMIIADSFETVAAFFGVLADSE